MRRRFLRAAHQDAFRPDPRLIRSVDKRQCLSIPAAL